MLRVLVGCLRLLLFVGIMAAIWAGGKFVVDALNQMLSPALAFLVIVSLTLLSFGGRPFAQRSTEN